MDPLLHLLQGKYSLLSYFTLRVSVCVGIVAAVQAAG
jgi:hypothetical protein